MRPMLAQMTFLQWKASRWVLLPFVLICFGLPQLVLNVATQPRYGEVVTATHVVYRLERWMPLFALLAAIVGFAAALSAWVWDHNARHVYALSLPLRRSQYALLKFGAGATSLLAAVAAVLVGALVAIVVNDIPAGLRAYPVAFTMRFLLATLIAYSLGFALAAGTVRTTVILIIAFLVFLIGGTIATGFIESALRIEMFTPLDLLHDAFAQWGGPFNVFGGFWALIDV
jgi:hypothetical protein